MKTRNILVVEDDLSIRNLLNDIYTEHGYNVTLAKNGKIGLEEFKKDEFPVVITDLRMPVMDGSELIDHLNSLKIPPGIIVLTATNNPEDIINIMKKNVFDYMIKPFGPEEIILKTEKAFKYAEINRSKIILENEKIIRLENQLEWFRWQEKFNNRDIQKIDKSLFHLLQTSFSQGAGFGSLVTISDIIMSTSKKEGDKYIINAKVYDMFTENIKMVKNAINIFQKIDEVKSQKLNSSEIIFKDVYNFIKTIIEELNEKADLKRQQILLSDFKPYENLNFTINKEYFHDAVYELLLNACKFSENNSNITVIVEPHEDMLKMIIINNPIVENKEIKGIPIEYENIIFEPFFRLSKLIFEKYNSLDFGLGLTLVENVVKAHGGKISACNVKDYSDISKEPVEKVSFTMTIPGKIQ